MKTLRETVEIYKGRKASEVFDEPESNTQRYLQIEDLRPNATIKYARDTNGVLANNDDVIIAWDGANAGTVSFGLAGYIGSTLAILRPRGKDVYAPFLGYFLQTKFNYLRDNTTGATIPHVNRDALEELALELPPLPEQRRIAALLDKADRLRRTRRYAAQLSDTFLQAVFVRMFGDIANNTRRWKLAELQNLCDEIYRYPTFYGFAYINTGVPVVRIGNILANGSLNPYLASYAFIDPEISKEFPRTILELDDIVMAVRGDGSTVERIGLVDSPNLVGANLSPNLIRFKANSKAIIPLYLFRLMTSKSGQQLLGRYITRTAKKTITATDIKEIQIPVPPLALQLKFARVVQQFERLRAQQREAERQAEHLFQTLLHRAFT